MNVLCAGMRRSGSTWLYNVLRSVLDTKGCFEDDLARDDWPDIQVVKTHKFTPHLLFGTDLIFISHRDLRDVASSAVLRSLIPNNTCQILGYLFTVFNKEYVPWSKLADYDMRYEDFYNDPLEEVTKIINTLGSEIDKDPKEVLDCINGIRPKAWYSRTNLLHPDHMTRQTPGHYQDVLDANTIAAIEAVFRDFLEREGYMTDG